MLGDVASFLLVGELDHTLDARHNVLNCFWRLSFDFLWNVWVRFDIDVEVQHTTD